MANLQNSSGHLFAFPPGAKGDQGGRHEPVAIARLLERPELASSTPLKGEKPRLRLIARTLEMQIIPKMVIAHREAQAATYQPPVIISTEDLAGFTTLVLANDIPACRRLIDAWAAHGADLAQICVDVLTPSAHRLGALWEEDACSFADVAAGIGTLQTLLHALHESCEPDIPFTDPSRHALLASLPGEHHSFGLQVLAELFHHAGWDARVEPNCTEATLTELVAQNHYAIAGFSVTENNTVTPLAHAIRAMRRVSLNPAIGVLVGGPVFNANPDLAHLVGADVTAADGKQAVLRADGLRLLAATLQSEHDLSHRRAFG